MDEPKPPRTLPTTMPLTQAELDALVAAWTLRALHGGEPVPRCRCVIVLWGQQRPQLDAPNREPDPL